jgi:hypothetical protein
VLSFLWYQMCLCCKCYRDVHQVQRTHSARVDCYHLEINDETVDWKLLNKICHFINTQAMVRACVDATLDTRFGADCNIRVRLFRFTDSKLFISETCDVAYNAITFCH